MMNQALSPECYHQQHAACYCSNSCGCLCHLYEGIEDDEPASMMSLEDWQDMIDDMEFKQNGYC